MAGTVVAERDRERQRAGTGAPPRPRGRKRDEDLCRGLVAAYAAGDGPSARAAPAQAAAVGATDPFAVQRSRWRPGPPEPLAVLLAFGFLLSALVFTVTALFGVP